MPHATIRLLFPLAFNPLNKLLIFGVGLIGGSLALALKRAHAVQHVVGIGRPGDNLQPALDLGVIDEATHDIAAALVDTDMVVIATPVAQIPLILTAIAPHLKPHTVVTDVGSTKSDVIRHAHAALPAHFERFVAGHPIAGAEKSGAAAAHLMARSVFATSDVPVLTLWAKRTEVTHFFDNPFNDAMVEGIAKVGRRGADGTQELLLIDDHMGTGATARQAVTYLRARLGDAIRVTFIPIISARRESIAVVEDLLPYSRVNDAGKHIFLVTKDQFMDLLGTKAQYFPYLRKQVYH